MAGTGVDWTFGPCIAVARDERWGRTYESFGEDPELVASLGAAAIRGFQEATDGSAILASAKHFLADGGTTGGKDRGDAHISEEELRRIHLPGYVAAIKAGVGSVMVSFSSWNGQPMHGNKQLITDVLKGELGFSGFVVTDWAAIDLMGTDYTQDVEMAINAGIDMVMVPIKFREFIADLKALVAAGRVPMARIDDAVRRILKQKARFRLLGEAARRADASPPTIGSPAHRAVARDAVRKSLVLLKNERADAAAQERRARPRLRLPRRRHGRAVRRLVGRLARPARQHHARHDHPAGADRAARRRARRLLQGRGRRRQGRRRGGGGGRGSLRRGERRSRQAGARRPRIGRWSRAAKRSGKPRRRRAAVRAADHPRRGARRRRRAGRGLAARAPRGAASPTCSRARPSRPASCRCRGRATWPRSRSTSAIRATRRCSRTASGCRGEEASPRPAATTRDGRRRRRAETATAATRDNGSEG